MSVQIVYWTSNKVAADRFCGIYCGTEYRVQQYFGNRKVGNIEGIKVQQQKFGETFTASQSIDTIQKQLAENDLLILPHSCMN